MNSKEQAGHRLDIVKRVARQKQSLFAKKSKEDAALLMAHLPFVQDVKDIRRKYGIPDDLNSSKDQYEIPVSGDCVLVGSWWREAYLTEKQDRELWDDINKIPGKHGYPDSYVGLVDSLVMYNEANYMPLIGASELLKITGKSKDYYLFFAYGNLEEEESLAYLNGSYGVLCPSNLNVKDSKLIGLNYAEISPELLMFRLTVAKEDAKTLKSYAKIVSEITNDHFKKERSMQNPERDYKIYWDYVIENKSYAEVVTSEWEFTDDITKGTDTKRGLIVRKASERFAKALAVKFGVTPQKT